MARSIEDAGRTSFSTHGFASGLNARQVGGGLGMLLIMIATIGCQAGSSGAEPPGKTEHDEFASDRETTTTDPVPFNGKRAMGYLEDVCKIGPRISGTEGMKKQQELLEKHFKDLGGKVEWQRFTAKQKSQRDKVEMVNMIVSWRRRTNAASSFATLRHGPIADQEPERRGANCLSVPPMAVPRRFLMELAHAMKDARPTSASISCCSTARSTS